MNTEVSSQIFSGARFGATLRRDWRMERDSWAWRLLAMLGVIAVMMIATTGLTHAGELLGDTAGEAVNYTERVVLAFICYFLLAIFSCLGASLFYSGYGSHGKRLNQLMNPASTLEKFASRFVICIIGVPVAFMVCWDVADYLRVWLGDMMYRGGVAEHVGLLDSLGIVKLKIDNGAFSFYNFLSWQAIYVLGSTVWPKNSFLKTVGALCVLEFVYGFVGGYCASMFFDFRNMSYNGDINIFDNLMAAVVAGNTITVLFCYITAYFRMREDEVIQRM